jgi:hypothetical protein
MAATRLEKSILTQVRVGSCGFPQALAPYAKTFPVVEVQQTFYQPPLLNTLEKWRTQVPAEFEFTLKAWQLITHESSSPTYRRLREKLTAQQRREVGASVTAGGASRLRSIGTGSRVHRAFRDGCDHGRRSMGRTESSPRK